MEITPNDSSLFRCAIEALKEFLPQAQLRVSSRGVAVFGMDAAHVGFVDYFLSANDCSMLKVAGGVQKTIGIVTADLACVLSNVGSGDKVTLSLSKDGAKLIVSYVNEKIAKKAVYELSTLMIDEDTIQIPELSFDASIQMKTSDVYGALKEVSVFGDVVHFVLNEDGFHISSSGDKGSVTQTLENTGDREMDLSGDDDVKIMLAVKYINQIFKGGASLSNKVHIQFDNGAQPLRAGFSFGTESRFVAFLAPKLSDE
jgi:proliferating cell nuclear antigen PCNA